MRSRGAIFLFCEVFGQFFQLLLAVQATARRECKISLCCVGTANPLSVSHSFDFVRSRISSYLLSARTRVASLVQAAPTVCSWAGRLLPAGLQNTLLGVHLIHSSKPHHTPAGFHLLPQPDFKLIYSLHASSTLRLAPLSAGRTSSLVRAASHTTPLCGSNHSLLPHP